MKKVLGKAILDYEEMETVLIEVEGVINNRPLTFVYDDITEPLTPAHLLAGRSLSSKKGEIVQEFDSSFAALTKRAKYLKKCLDMFWNRFRTAYLSELREHHMHSALKDKSNETCKIKIGEGVIVKEEKITPRSNWRMGRVESFVKSKDGKIRGVELVTITNGKISRIKRPIQKIIRLEV